MGKALSIIARVENNEMFIDRRGKFANAFRANPPGNTDAVINVPPEGDPPLPVPVRFQRRATFGQTNI